ncbi:hypothetical protein [Nonomuraea sp. NPDC049758]|uniref:RICIN domain-containing protein n=1 Tax=Nonomuraea sp. NPDC049758 TaxID=3154360 RepID=UPI00343CA63D
MSKPRTFLNAITAAFLAFAVQPPAPADADSSRDRGPDTWITNPITGGQLFVDIPNACRYNIENPECVLGSRVRLGAQVGGNYHSFFFESPPGGGSGKCLDVENGAYPDWPRPDAPLQIWRPARRRTALRHRHPRRGPAAHRLPA